MKIERCIVFGKWWFSRTIFERVLNDHEEVGGGAPEVKPRKDVTKCLKDEDQWPKGLVYCLIKRVLNFTFPLWKLSQISCVKCSCHIYWYASHETLILIFMFLLPVTVWIAPDKNIQIVDTDTIMRSFCYFLKFQIHINVVIWSRSIN